MTYPGPAAASALPHSRGRGALGRGALGRGEHDGDHNPAVSHNPPNAVRYHAVHRGTA